MSSSVVIALTYILVMFLSLLAYAAGLRLWAAMDDERLPPIAPALAKSSAFFLGLMSFLCTWKILDHCISNARVTLFATVVVMLFAAAGARRALIADLKHHGGKFLGVFIAVSLLSILRALDPMPRAEMQNLDYLNPFHGVGYVVVHTFRAGNISSWAWQNNTLPFLKQHVGQSLLGLPSLLLYARGTLISLLLWMSMCQIFFATLTMGLIAELVPKKPRLQKIAWWIAFFGATLPAYHLNFISDVFSINFIINSIDALLGIASAMIVFYLFWRASMGEQTRHGQWAMGAAFVLVGFAWNLSASQNIVLVSGILLLWIALAVRVHHPRRKKVAGIYLALLVGALLGTREGGMLYGGDRVPEHLPGSLEVKVSGEKAMEITWPFTTHKFHPSFQLKRYVRTALQKEAHLRAALETYQKSDAWWKELILWSEADLRYAVYDPGNGFVNENSFKDFIVTVPKSLLYVLFPLMGIWASLRRRSSRDDFYERFVRSGAVLFFGGWFLSGCFILGGFRFEMTRFFYLGIYMAMVLFGITVAYWIDDARPALRKFAWGLAVVTLFSPLFYWVTILGVNVRESLRPKEDCMTFQEKIAVMTDLVSIVGTKGDWYTSPSK